MPGCGGNGVGALVGRALRDHFAGGLGDERGRVGHLLFRLGHEFGQEPAQALKLFRQVVAHILPSAFLSL
jgi:hypothetical protein